MIYLLFFLSGATALIYQVVWVRSLTLVFGGSHLAVTAVLSTFMAGLAIGGFVFGRRADRAARLLRLYGLLEIGIALSALVFVGLMQVYPRLYVALARGRDEATAYLTAIRLLFAVGALIVPTVLMGGTLPVLSRFAARGRYGVRRQVSMLYGLNTFGAVAGALLAGFVLLRLYSVTASLAVAVALNLLIGAVSIILQRRWDAAAPAAAAGEPVEADDVPAASADEWRDARCLRPLLWGIGVSGFCALGYEVLWTRVLSMAIGASVYGFTVILVAFLTGIALGSHAYGVLSSAPRFAPARPRAMAAWFGVLQVLIGATALAVTIVLRDIPAVAIRFETWILEADFASFSSRMWSSFVLAFAYMVVPALFMGAAFPLAADAIARQRRAVGRAVGDALASNTIGAVLGAGLSGLLLIQLFGLERSLVMLTVLNLGLGVIVLAHLAEARWIAGACAAIPVAALAFLAVDPDAIRIWDRTYFAIFRSNQPEAFRTPEMVREAVENTDVLYYAEGVESIVSVIRVKGGEQAFITNGRVEASSHLQAQQVQYTLGHLPMLLARDPKDVLVVGMGSGMTAGATAVHPTTSSVTIVEIEPKVLGVAATFPDYNHRVLENSKVKVVLNDGRNFLMTTGRQFDVITADPIHPWFRGAGYLYTSEYFRLAAEHLRPGGVAAQWLPIYELTPEDLASVVRTFQLHFAHTMLWLTHYDAVIVGSNEPFALDEAELERRIAAPQVAEDLERVAMGSAADLLGYFVMGTGQMKQFAQAGPVNSDDRLYLEFSAPFSIATSAVMGINVQALAAHRESILPYLKPGGDEGGRERQRQWATQQLTAGAVGDQALALFLAGGRTDPQFLRALHRLNITYPAYAPGRFLANEYMSTLALEPRLLQQTSLALASAEGRVTQYELSAVLVPVSGTRASIMFVDNRARVIYGECYLDDYARDGSADRVATEVMSAIRAAYDSAVTAAREERGGLPLSEPTLQQIRTVIATKVQRVATPS